MRDRLPRGGSDGGERASQLAAGEAVEVKGGRRRGLQRMLITVAEMLGTNGTIAVGVALLVLIVGWAVWLPENA